MNTTTTQKEHAFYPYPHELAAATDKRLKIVLRAIEPQPVLGYDDNKPVYEWGWIHGAPKASSPKLCYWDAENWWHSAPITGCCPYGRKGDRLLFKETWQKVWDNKLIGGKGEFFCIALNTTMQRLVRWQDGNPPSLCLALPCDLPRAFLK